MMAEFQLKTPIVFIIFNRPDTTVKVFEAIRAAKPSKLLVIADGPRVGRTDDNEKCEAARAIIDRVDWPCEVLKNYSDINLGCAKRVSSGLNWVFANEEEAIILEDDCIPDPTFFRFCQELLSYYRNDERIMVISGNNFQFGHKRTKDSYYFSRYNHCWGWATWKRAWQYFDFEMSSWPYVRDNQWLIDILGNSEAAENWKNTFQAVFEHKLNSWAIRWTFACWLQSGLAVLPNVNLVSNIGFDTDATHTVQTSIFDSMPVEAMKFPLQHPKFMIRDSVADEITQRNNFSWYASQQGLLSKTKDAVKKLLKWTTDGLN
jgi:hypothetical protein